MRVRGACIALLVALGCGSERRAETPVAEQTQETSAPERRAEAETETETPPAPTCEERLSEAMDVVASAVDAHAECTFDVDCVAAHGGGECISGCDVAIHPRGIDALRAAGERVTNELCPAFAEAGCEPARAECARSTPRCVSGRCAMDEGDAPLREMPVPPQNEAARSDDPPPRPAPGEAEDERGRRLFEAIVHDEPERASDFFFPREAFAVVKAIADPDGYWQRLYRRYTRDIHELHASLGDLSNAEYQRLEIIRRGGWVPIREEGNALPYWVARHNRLYYTVDGEERSLEVRVTITWGERWYITHLSEFH
jgi:hypothetical protein